jgi:uncharacterized protein YbjQ (UPF0145 family)
MVNLFGRKEEPKQEFDYHIDPNLPFTSELTGQEFWLALDKGYRPAGLVLGNCVYSLGVIRHLVGGWKARFRGDVQEFSQLLYDARKIALERMQQEARLLGADGIIGVSIKIRELTEVLGTEGEFIEVTAIGTAVKYDPSIQGRSSGQVVIPVGEAPGEGSD